ncbi:LolA family protein [Paenarthrobacter nicotinovorans]|uniref:LolA family protein n=1 Tax=Paenarthrobacter nicotinovorans TaxID=29320 RepID=UPI003DA3FD8E
MTRARRRWLPALLISLAMGMAVLFGAVQAGASGSLPPKTADEILAMIARTQVRELSGTLEQTAELGLPEVPAAGPGVAPGTVSALEFLTGSHTARVYIDGPSKARVQILDRMAERDLVLNGEDAWFYDSSDNSATHVSIPRPPVGAPTESRVPESPRPTFPTPEALASRFLTAIDASTEVSVGNSSSVAGRSAYKLLLKPRTAGTLVDAVAIDVDAETGLPLGIELRAKGQAEPAYSLEYTQLDLTAPDASLFEFVPPQGASVSEKTIPAAPIPSMPLPVPSGPTTQPHPTQPHPTQPHHGATVTGAGWDAVISLPAGTAPAGLTASPELTQALQAVPGGRALTTSVISVLILDDGRVYAGMVPLERLQAVAQQLNVPAP